MAEIGRRLARRRVNMEITPAAMAERAGVSKRTVERIEAGESTQMATIVRILRVLGLLDNLDRMIPEPGPSPIALLKLKGKERVHCNVFQRLVPMPNRPTESTSINWLHLRRMSWQTSACSKCDRCAIRAPMTQRSHFKYALRAGKRRCPCAATAG